MRNNTVIELLNDIKNAEAMVIKGNYDDLCYFNSTLWFIPCFFASECFLFVISKVIRNKKEIFLISLFLTTVTNLGLMPWIGIWHITESWSYLIWMAMGYCINDLIRKFTENASTEMLLGIAMGGFAVLSLAVDTFVSVDKARCPLSPIGIIALIALSIAVCRIVNNNRLLGGISEVGKSTMLVLLTHQYFVDELHKNFLGISENILASITISIAIVIVITVARFAIRWFLIKIGMGMEQLHSVK